MALAERSAAGASNSSEAVAPEEEPENADEEDGDAAKAVADPWKKSCCICCGFGGDWLPTATVAPTGTPPAVGRAIGEKVGEVDVAFDESMPPAVGDNDDDTRPEPGAPA